MISRKEQDYLIKNRPAWIGDAQVHGSLNRPARVADTQLRGSVIRKSDPR